MPTVITSSFPKRDPALPWDQVAPGLYAGEVAVELETGEKVAISVDPEWLENGQGVSLNGNARLVEDDGSTRLDPNARHVEANLQATASALDVTEFGVSALAREVARIILGQEPGLMRPADPALEVPERPVFDIAPQGRAAASIKAAADSVKALATFRLRM